MREDKCLEFKENIQSNTFLKAPLLQMGGK